MTKKIEHKITFKTINEQLQILSSRGLNFNDKHKASLYLLTNNYFNIINGYSKYFQSSNDPEDDQYVEDANFDEVCNLYLFDKDIKQALFNSILHVEHHLKSILAYRFAETYPNKRYAYLDLECYNHDKKHRVNALETISKISRLIETKIKYKDDVITHYVNKYDDIPIWVLVDFLDFGTLGLVIKSLPTNIQNKIAKDLNNFIYENEALSSLHSQKIQTFTPEMLNSFIKNIREIRNICAHNNRLLDFNCRSDSIYFPALHDKYNLGSKSRRRSIYSNVVNMQCFLSPVEYAILCNTIRKRLRNLSSNLHSIDITKITRTLGFPDHWEEKKKKIQQKKFIH